MAQGPPRSGLNFGIPDGEHPASLPGNAFGGGGSVQKADRVDTDDADASSLELAPNARRIARMWCLAVSLMTSTCVVRPRVYRGEWVKPPPGTLGAIDEEPWAVGCLRVLSRRTLRFVSARAIKRMPAA